MHHLPPTRIVVVDDHAIVRECIRALLERQTGMTVVGTAASGEQAILVAQRLQPDLIIMDLMLPGMTGTEATRAILGMLPHARVIILSCSFISEHIHGALRVGAHGYVVKEALGSELASAIETVMTGTRYCSPQIASALADREQSDAASPNHWEHLSSREREVLRRTAAGTSTAQIAQLLSLSPKTVDTYRSRLMRKLGLSSRSTLIRYAMQHSISPY
jgi:DNA-binding NarL/FixJ family response regulator